MKKNIKCFSIHVFHEFVFKYTVQLSVHNISKEKKYDE